MSIIGKIFGFFTGGSKTAEKVIDAADDLVHTEQEKSAEAAADLTEARRMFSGGGGTAFDSFVDGINRLVRPGITIWLVGGFAGAWALPGLDKISEFWQNVFIILMTFWFGGRAVLKDLPSAIRAMRGMK